MVAMVPLNDCPSVRLLGGVTLTLMGASATWAVPVALADSLAPSLTETVTE